MWNDTDIPIAYLITFRCYGTWLHGDERGSVDREHNRYKTPYAAVNNNRRRHNQHLLKSEPVLLSAEQRASVEKAIGDTAYIASGACTPAMSARITCIQLFRLVRKNLSSR